MDKSSYVDSSKELIIASIVNIITCSAIIIFCLYHAETYTIDIFRRVSNGSYYVEATKLGPMIVLAIPALLAFLISSALLLSKRLKKTTGTKIGKVFVTFSLLAVGGSLLMWPILNNQLDRYNYHYCFFYSGSNIASPPVYVKNPDHCIATPRQNIDEILAWFDEQESAGVRLTAKGVKQKVDELKEISGY